MRRVRDRPPRLRLGRDGYGYGRGRQDGSGVRALREEGLRAVLRHKRGWDEKVSPVRGEEGVGWGSGVDDGSWCSCLIGRGAWGFLMVCGCFLGRVLHWRYFFILFFGLGIGVLKEPALISLHGHVTVVSTMGEPERWPAMRDKETCAGCPMAPSAALRSSSCPPSFCS